MKSCGHKNEQRVEHPITREQWRICLDCPAERTVVYERFFEATS